MIDFGEKKILSEVLRCLLAYSYCANVISYYHLILFYKLNKRYKHDVQHAICSLVSSLLCVHVREQKLSQCKQTGTLSSMK